MEMEARSSSRTWISQHPRTVLGEMIPRIGPLGWCLCRRGWPSELSWFCQLYLSWHPTYKNFKSVVSVLVIFERLSRNVRTHLGCQEIWRQIASVYLISHHMFIDKMATLGVYPIFRHTENFILLHDVPFISLKNIPTKCLVFPVFVA